MFETKQRDKAQAPWQAAWLLAAPHRLAFFMAAVMLAASGAWWGLLLLFWSIGITPAWSVSASPAHGLLMSMGFMPLFFAGFLFTAGPKWLGVTALAPRQLLPGLLLMLGGWWLAFLGFHTLTAVASAGVVLVATGWTALVLKFFKLLRQSLVPDRVHASLAAAGCGVGVVTLWMAAVSLALHSDLLLKIATQIGIWGFLATVFVAVSHRMIPFFGASALPVLDAWRPLWLLAVLTGMVWLEGVLGVLDLLQFQISTVWLWLRVAFEAGSSALLLWLAIRWGLVQSLKIRLLAMLHGGFAWLGIAFALSAISHALMALTQGEMSLGLAPLHAMTMGYLGSTMFAMTTRVSSGHGGRPVAADDVAWRLYWILQLAIFLRVIAAIWPEMSAPLTLLAIAAWVIATAGWAWRYGNWFGRPRPDGRPG